MIIVSILAMVSVFFAAWAGLHILKKEYLPLLNELERTKHAMKKAEGQDCFGKGRMG